MGTITAVQFKSQPISGEMAVKYRISALLCRKTCHSKARAQYLDLQAAACVVKCCPMVAQPLSRRPKRCGHSLFSSAQSSSQAEPAEPQLPALGKQHDAVKTKATLKFVSFECYLEFML